ncbi:MAG: hypothetical protein ABIQ16_11790 [Polyangiaceae bacterium]
MSTEADNVDTSAEVAGTEADKINTGALGTLVAVGLLAMISITAAVTALVRHDIEVEEAHKDADANQVVTALKAKQRATLNGPSGYVDRGKGTVSLPIDLAKGLVVSELGKDPNRATPPAPIKPDAGVEVTTAAVDGGASAATLASGGASGRAAKDASAGTSGKTEKPDTAEHTKAPADKPETGRKVLESGGSTKAIVPTPTPTAATPGAEQPGPMNK